MKIVIDNKIPFIRGVFEQYAEVVYLPGKETTPELVKDADAIITRTRTICNSKLLSGSKVKAIATATIGFDHIDTEWCESNGIAWSNAPGCNSWSVEQYICSVLVSLARRHVLNLAAMTLGVIGAGNVGSKVARAAAALGMNVLVNDPPRERREGPAGFVSLDTVISEADIITIHVPLEKEGKDATWHLFDGKRLSRLRKEQWLINSSRGPVVDNKALKATLKAHDIAGAVLDVWEDEPAPDPELVNLLEYSTPHIAGYSADGKANGTSMSVRYIARQLNLPLMDWKAEEIPLPAQSLEFEIDAERKSDQEALTEAILHTYDVQSDTDALRAGLEKFEKLRGDYPVRREPSAFTIRLKGGTDHLCSSLRTLGFNLKENK
jgi:Phosphoglycerate dehydrogenase and related dehydrogenases